MTINYQPVEFASEGAMLRGRLYTPAMGITPGKSPLVVMAHGFTATIRMTADRYAEAFATRGLAVLLYDHHSLGSSGGEPRRVINPWTQARGYRDAVDFAHGLPAIDPSRIGLWGDSFSGMQVIVLAAVLDGIAAVSALTPACGDQPPPEDPDARLFRMLRETFENGNVGTPETTFGPLPVVSWDPLRHPAHLEPLTAFRWFMEHGGRPGSQWINDATRVVPATPAPFSAGIAAPQVKVPVQVIYAPDDEMRRAMPSVTRMVCARLRDPKEIIELEAGCGHFGQLWYPSEWFNRVTELQASFFLRQLAPAAARSPSRD